MVLAVDQTDFAFWDFASFKNTNKEENDKIQLIIITKVHLSLANIVIFAYKMI